MIKSNVDVVTEIVDSIKSKGDSLLSNVSSITYDYYTTTNPNSAMQNGFEVLQNNCASFCDVLRKDADKVQKIANQFDEVDKKIGREYRR